MMRTPFRSVLVIEGRFYDDIADELLRGATLELAARGVSHEVMSVPGALEIPQVLASAVTAGLFGGSDARTARFGGCVALGCVIRGETSHYDIVAGESARALMDIAIASNIALGNGILTVETHAQAMARARVDGRNKGRDAVGACLAVMALQASFQRQPGERA
jgi:6,7-dimethyl-8-ribityllumazine synthase